MPGSAIVIVRRPRHYSGMIRLDEIYRYPVKGLNAERLTAVDIREERGLDGDRAFAIAHGSTDFDPVNPRPLPKTKFLMLMRNARLAALDARFDAATNHLAITRAGRQVARGDLSMPLGRTLIEQFLGAYLAGETRGAPKIVSAQGHRFYDRGKPTVSILNLASVSAFSDVARHAVDPQRFRANLHISGNSPWEEFGWLGKLIGIGGVRLRVTERIRRCAATEVNPATADRDLNVLKLLASAYDHTDMGVYAEVVSGGQVRTGDTITLHES